jgi:hypothetical protein
MTHGGTQAVTNRDGSMRMTQPRHGQFTNHSMSARPVVLHCKVVHDNLFPT